MTILEAMADPKLFAPWFQGEHWTAWRAFLAALFGLPMSGDGAEVYGACTGRQALPAGPAREGWLIVGRRGGKSIVPRSSPCTWPRSATTASIWRRGRSRPLR